MIISYATTYIRNPLNTRGGIEFGSVIGILSRIIVIGNVVQVAYKIFKDGGFLKEKELKLAGIETDLRAFFLVALVDLDQDIQRRLPIPLELIDQRIIVHIGRIVQILELDDTWAVGIVVTNHLGRIGHIGIERLGCGDNPWIIEEAPLGRIPDHVLACRGLHSHVIFGNRIGQTINHTGVGP